MKKIITREILIEKARVWLKKKCVVVTSETFTSELVPVRGALGWTQFNETVYIECVLDRPDLTRKSKNLSIEFPYGDYRLILTVPGVVKNYQKELPTGWGLLIYDRSQRTVIYQELAKLQQKNPYSELTVIISILRRIGSHAEKKGEDWVDSYKFLYDNRALLSVAVLANTLEVDEEELE